MHRYIVGIREVHISYREVQSDKLLTEEEVIDLALDEGVEFDVDYSHTLDSSLHSVELQED